jgi:hypothetical protein
MQSFSLFQRLPPELRIMIWYEALASMEEPGLFSHKIGCWTFTQNHSLVLEFQKEHLYDMQFSTSLLYVNYETRDIAFDWIRKHNTKLRIDEQRQVFIRKFSYAYDAVYHTHENWIKFFWGSDTQPRENLYHYVPVYAEVVRIAVPEDFFRNTSLSLLRLQQAINFYQRVKLIYVVLNMPTQRLAMSDEFNLQESWRIQNTQGGSFIWNHSSGSFNCVGTQIRGKQDLYDSIEEVCTTLSDKIRRNDWDENHTFEIRPVFAIRG